MSARAVFLDRDGTLITNRNFGFRPNEIEFMDGLIEGLRLLQRAGFDLVVVTNQSGVARGLFSESAVQEMHSRMEDLLARVGITLSRFYYCPHHPEGQVPEYSFDCDCRKPRQGLILRATGELGIDSTRSWLVGDIMDDILAGRRAGCRTILVNGWYERLKHSFHPHPHFIANNFLQAARLMVGTHQ